jgi:hypothetical protein
MENAKGRKRERDGKEGVNDYKEARKPGKEKPDLLVSWLPYQSVGFRVFTLSFGFTARMLTINIARGSMARLL